MLGPPASRTVPPSGGAGFELLAAPHRWEQAVATGDVPRAIRRRFDLRTDILGLDRQRATGWTLARILQNVLWDVEHDDTIWHIEPDRAIAECGHASLAASARGAVARLCSEGWQREPCI